jgi:hypothetical protein
MTRREEAREAYALLAVEAAELGHRMHDPRERVVAGGVSRVGYCSRCGERASVTVTAEALDARAPRDRCR